MKANVKVLKLMLFCLFTMAFTGCGNDDEEINMTENDVLICISVVSSKGDLLDPDVEGNILSTNISAVFQNKTYKYDINNTISTTSWNLAWGQVGKTNVLMFGILPEYTAFNEEPLTIKWADGSEDTITITVKPDCYYTDYINTEEIVYKEHPFWFWLNGELVGDHSSWPVITIRK